MERREILTDGAWRGLHRWSVERYLQMERGEIFTDGVWSERSLQIERGKVLTDGA